MQSNVKIIHLLHISMGIILMTFIIGRHYGIIDKILNNSQMRKTDGWRRCERLRAAIILMDAKSRKATPCTRNGNESISLHTRLLYSPPVFFAFLLLVALAPLLYTTMGSSNIRSWSHLPRICRSNTLAPFLTPTRNKLFTFFFSYFLY